MNVVPDSLVFFTKSTKLSELNKILIIYDTYNAGLREEPVAAVYFSIFFLIFHSNFYMVRIWCTNDVSQVF